MIYYHLVKKSLLYSKCKINLNHWSELWLCKYLCKTDQVAIDLDNGLFFLCVLIGKIHNQWPNLFLHCSNSTKNYYINSEYCVTLTYLLCTYSLFQVFRGNGQDQVEFAYGSKARTEEFQTVIEKKLSAKRVWKIGPKRKNTKNCQHGL